jgi:hypothetical protein
MSKRSTTSSSRTQSASSKRGGKGRAAANAKNQKPPTPQPLKIEPVYSYHLNFQTLQEEERRLQEIVDNSEPVLSSRKEELDNERELVLKDPSKVFENEEYFFQNRADKYIKKNILGATVKNIELEISNGATDFTEDDVDLKKEMLKVYKQPKALTLWGMSEGTSSISNRGATSSYFMNDFDRFRKADSDASGRGSSLYFTNTIEGRNSRPSSAQLTKLRPASASESIRRALVPLSKSMNSNMSLSVSNAGERYIEPPVDDPSWRTYSSSPTGRTVSSIYNSSTKRPTKIHSFIDKSKITNESLYTYISTEFVEELDLERCNWINNKILVNIGQFCPSLTTLNFQNCTQIVDSTIRIIVNGCPSLKFINLG